jgi:hypothetical protein
MSEPTVITLEIDPEELRGGREATLTVAAVTPDPAPSPLPSNSPAAESGEA